MSGKETGMRTADAVKTIHELDQSGRAVFTTDDLRVIFRERSESTFAASLTRLVRQGVLQRAARGVYVNPRTRIRRFRLQLLALALRPGQENYLSLETALGIYSLISQQTLGNITVVTTGRKGRFSTPWGGIRFTRTTRSVDEIRALTVDVGNPIRWAKPRTALEDLRRTRRNLELVDIDDEELELVEREMGLPPPTEAERRQLLFWKTLPWVTNPPRRQG